MNSVYDKVHIPLKKSIITPLKTLGKYNSQVSKTLGSYNNPVKRKLGHYC